MYLKLELEEFELLKKSLECNIQTYYDLAIDAFAVNDSEFARKCVTTKLEFEKLQNLLEYRMIDVPITENAVCSCCGTPIADFNKCNEDDLQN